MRTIKQDEREENRVTIDRNSLSKERAVRLKITDKEEPSIQISGGRTYAKVLW